MSHSVKTSHLSDNKLTYYIITGWAIVVLGILAYYIHHKEAKNEFWSFNSQKKTVYVVLDNGTKKLTNKRLEELYETLSWIQDLENSTIIDSKKLTQKHLNNNNTLFLGSWMNLNLLQSLVPSFIIQFDASKQVLHWKHNNGFYDLPLGNNQQNMTYALALKIQTNDKHQSTLFISFDEIDQSAYLHYLLEKSNIETLTSKLKITSSSTSFIALYKIPKKDSKTGKIELLDGFILTP